MRFAAGGRRTWPRGGASHLDVLRVDVGVGVQQQADDSGVPGQHGPVQRGVFVVLVAEVDGHVEGQ